MENKLTIEQLKNYLGTGLKINRIWITAYGGFDRQELDVTVLYHCRLDQIVPHCYRLSDLDKFIPELGFVPIEELIKHLGYGETYQKCITWRWANVNTKLTRLIVLESNVCRELVLNVINTRGFPMWVLEKLFQWHFWPFGDEYFEQGLVIDKLKHGN